MYESYQLWTYKLTFQKNGFILSKVKIFYYHVKVLTVEIHLQDENCSSEQTDEGGSANNYLLSNYQT